MINVLMATYRCPPDILAAQRDSILSQKDVDVRLTAREDVAGDGAMANFAALLSSAVKSGERYMAFSDQDDVWLPQKLSKSLAAMRALEAACGEDSPLLVFTDSKVVDANLNPLADSLFKRTRIDPRRLLPRQLIMQNVPYGNTMLFNAALARLADPIPPEAFMHDHWLMLVASVFGHAAFVDEPLLLYRQHGANVIGGAKVDAGYFLAKATRGLDDARRRVKAYIRQAAAFHRRFGDAAPPCFAACAEMERAGWFRRRLDIIRHGIWKQGLARNIGLLAVV